MVIFSLMFSVIKNDKSNRNVQHNFVVVKTFTYENREKTRELKCGDEDERRRTEDVRVITCLCVEMYNLCGSLRNEWGQLIVGDGDRRCQRLYSVILSLRVCGDLIGRSDNFHRQRGQRSLYL